MRESADVRRQALIDATARCLAERGVGGTSVRAICARAGVSSGLLTHYFAGVDALMVTNLVNVRYLTGYTGTNGIVVFPAGTTNQSIPVRILGDGISEPTETFQFVISNAVSLILGAQTNTVITITDDDSRLQFTFGATNVLEDVGSVVFTVSRTGNLNSTVTVPFTTVNGTATALLDFMPHIVSDLHEMGGNSTYYFPPNAVPGNTWTTDAQRGLSEMLGQAMAKAFDARGFAAGLLGLNS